MVSENKYNISDFISAIFVTLIYNIFSIMTFSRRTFFILMEQKQIASFENNFIFENISNSDLYMYLSTLSQNIELVFIILFTLLVYSLKKKNNNYLPYILCLFFFALNLIYYLIIKNNELYNGLFIDMNTPVFISVLIAIGFILYFKRKNN